GSTSSASCAAITSKVAWRSMPAAKDEAKALRGAVGVSCIGSTEHPQAVDRVIDECEQNGRRDLRRPDGEARREEQREQRRVRERLRCQRDHEAPAGDRQAVRWREHAPVRQREARERAAAKTDRAPGERRKTQGEESVHY